MTSRVAQLALLGLGTNASHAAIKARYRELAKSHHPDLNPAADLQEFQELTAAYRALLDNPPPASATDSGQGPAMQARWNVRRRHTPMEYPAWFKPPDGNDGNGRGMHHRAGWNTGSYALRMHRKSLAVNLLRAFR
mmetsp:Transcript_43992/g.115573  ORF Transcript_43992/g.115573 Transcript_43992/m.115573 type:complete len:136 (-) Transcript_43992:327-734(-)